MVFDQPQYGLFGERFHIWPGAAGRQLLFDPEDSKTLEEVTIEVSDRNNTALHWRSQRVSIKTQRPPGEERRLSDIYRAAQYELYRQDDNLILDVANRYSIYDVLTDEMATHLFNTIDSLIPNATSPTPQTERIASQETLTPPTLPYPGRRPAG